MGCWCASIQNPSADETAGDSESEHARLSAMLDMNNVVVVGDAADDDLKLLRDTIYIETRRVCGDLALAQFPGLDDNCDASPIPIDDQDGDMSSPEVTPIFPVGENGDCIADEAYYVGSPIVGAQAVAIDNYDDYYSLGSVIAYNSGTQKYEIDEDFFYDMLDNPDWLVHDHARVEPASGSGWKFTDVRNGEILYALGIRTNDRIVSLNGYTFTDWGDVIEAHENLQNSTAFTLVVFRSTTSVTLKFQVVP